MISASCPICGMQTNCPDEMAGKQVPCGGCGTNITVAAGSDLGGGGLGGYGGYGATSQEPAKSKGGSDAWYFKWWALALGGVAALLLVGGLVFLFSPKPEPPPVAQAEPPPSPPEPPKEEKPAPPKGPTIEPVEAITVEAGGTAKVTIKIQRGSATGAIPVRLEDLPGQVTAEQVTIDDGKDSAELVFTAAPDAPASAAPAKVKIIVEAGELKAEQQIELTVKPPPPPVLSTVAALTIRPGVASELEVKVDRKGFMGPIMLAFEGLPAKVTAKKSALADGTADPNTADPSAADPNAAGQQTVAPDLTIPEAESALKITLTAAADVAEGPATPKLTTTVREQKVETSLKLTIERFSFRVRFNPPTPVVTLKPGESKALDVVVDRRSYKGPLKLEPTGLPEKVTAAPVEIAENGTNAKLQVTAAADAREQVKSAALAGKANNATVNEALVVRVSKDDGGFLPNEVTADPEFAKLLKRDTINVRLDASTKNALLKAYGGTEQSEAAVLKGLAWLIKHQNEEKGTWTFAEAGQAGVAAGGATETEGEVKDFGVAATAFGVLPFLGVGVVHDRSPTEPAVLKEYRPKVFKALAWIALQQMTDKKDPKSDGELPGGMYAHALGTLALCEAYGLSKEPQLKNPAQRAIKYLLQSAHAEKGFRSDPRQPGDASVMGWVFQAVRSAQIAGLSVDRSSLEKAGKYLNTCAVGPGDAKLSRYSYLPGEPANLTTTAAALLSRQQLGWERDNPELVSGCKYLMENLPPEHSDQLGSIYYYHYATQVLFNAEGENWDRWNHCIREHLLQTQEKTGETVGSWNPTGTDVGSKAARIQATSLALMTLEAYYRHLPLRRTVKVADAK